MTKSLLRSFLKGLIWELTGPLILYALIQEWRICLTYCGIRIILFFLYVRLWKKVKWLKEAQN